jgi:hypothetical protein
MEITALSDIAPFIVIEVDLYLRSACCLHHSWYTPLKRRSASTRLRGVIFQSSPVFILILFECRYYLDEFRASETSFSTVIS